MNELKKKTRPKRVLLIAFHYPPCGVSSGLQRTLAFTRYLCRYGWVPALVTVSTNAYEKTSRAQLTSIPPEMRIFRAPTVDAARHFSIAGRYPSFLAVPDRWRSWRITGLWAARRLVREFRPDVVWSTYPIATAHRIAADLVRATGLPWVADMRDPMVEFEPVDGLWYPADDAIRTARLAIESDVNQLAAAAVFCTNGARRIFKGRYGSGEGPHLAVIPNGFDETVFAEVEAARAGSTQRKRTGFHALHSGTVYPGSDRGPEALFASIRELSLKRQLPNGFCLTMRATGHDEYIAGLISAHNVDEFVRLAPPIAYHEALAEMLAADALVVLQGYSSNPAIPAKIYEYLRARRPILGLVHPDGETAGMLSGIGIAFCAPLDDSSAIQDALARLIERHEKWERPIVPYSELARYSREELTGELGSLLDSVCAT